MRDAVERGVRVRRSRLIDIACIAAVAVFGLLAITPVAFLGFGIAIRTRPYLTIDENAVVVKALIGSAQETYGLTAADVIEFDGKRVFLVNQGGRRRLRGVTGWLANRHDWAAFQAWAEQRHGGA